MNKTLYRIAFLLALPFLFPVLSCASARAQAETFPPQAPPETVSIYSFNIQIFGAAKMAKPGVKEALAEIVARSDICAIQEVRSARPGPVEDFMALLPERCHYVLGRREGRSSSKEQYWVIYDSMKFLLLGAESYPDPEDKFERDPLGLYFRTNSRFDFIIINNHISPSDAANEIAALPEAARWFSDLWDEKDVIILGDFNADGAYYGEEHLAEVFPWPDWFSLITDDLDTTIAASENTYDRIIISASALEDYSGSRGVFRFDEEESFPARGLEPKALSDHYPVWAEFFIDFDTD